MSLRDLEQSRRQQQHKSHKTKGSMNEIVVLRPRPNVELHKRNANKYCFCLFAAGSSQVKFDVWPWLEQNGLSDVHVLYKKFELAHFTPLF